MSGKHHQRTGWTYSPRPRGTCSHCGESKTVDTRGLVVTHRIRHNGTLTGTRCRGSRQPPQEPAMTQTASLDTAITTVVDNANQVARAVATLRAEMVKAMNALVQLQDSLQHAGLLDDPVTGPAHIEASRTQTLERLAEALDIPQELLDGPSPDGLPDHWTQAAPLGMPQRRYEGCQAAGGVCVPQGCSAC